MDVLCLEQGDWPDRAAYPGPKPDWELQAMKQWAPDPNVRGGPADYPIDVSASDIVPLMYSGVGGSTVLYAGDWPRLTPSDFRVRSLDGVADDWPLTYEELEPYYDRIARQVGVAGFAGDPAYPAGADLPLPPLPLGRGVMDVVRAHDRLGWHWWPAPSAILSAPVRGPARVRAAGASCMQGCPEGAKASTDVTALAAGDRARRPRAHGRARRRRLLLGAGRPRDAAPSTWTRRAARERAEADVVVLAANAVGTARLLLLSAGGAFPDGLANTSGLVGRRLMMHPFAVATGVFPRAARDVARQRRLAHPLAAVLRDRRAPRLRARREVEPRAVDRRADERRDAGPRRRRRLGCPSTTRACASASATA